MPCKPAARKGDLCVHGGRIVQGSPNVTVGGMPAARLLHHHVCPIPGHVGGPITQSSPTVFINGFGAARMGDAATCMAPPVPAAGADGGGPDENGKLKLKGDFGKEKKWGEHEGEGSSKSLKDAYDKAKDDYKKKPDEGFKPKLAIQAGQEWKKEGSVDHIGSDDNQVALLAGEAKAGWSAGAEFESVKDMKAGAQVKAEAEGSYMKAKGKLGDAKTGFGEVGGEAKLLTAKADAGAGGKVEVKNGQLESAYVEAGAGAGASVVEGKVEGKTKSFKLPFVNWGISFGGEVSGALLTAEARASAHAGYKDKKWSFGFGAKLGAAIAGLGFKFNVTIEKLEAPKPPPKAPGVPGAAGIDPIALGCFTVLIGDAPKPYVPGPPKKADAGLVGQRRPENLNKAGPKLPPKPGAPPVRQSSSDLDELYVEAAIAFEELSKITHGLANMMNGVAKVPPGLKGKERTLEKIATEYGGDAGQIMDLARSSILFDKMADLEKALAHIEGNLEVVRKKDRFASPKDGYRDILLNVKTSNGHICEMQLHLKEIHDIKEHGVGHKLYDVVRGLEAKSVAENRPLTPSEIAKIDDAKKQMKAAYDAAFKKAL